MNLTAKVKTIFTRGIRGKSATGPALLGAKRIHPTVREIGERLNGAGFSAFVVGGAVRDLLMSRDPRDFDLATDARPEQVKRLFHNARIIGRRFRLVHLTYPDMVVEVSTFRSASPRRRGGMIVRDNTWGTPEEDAFRRDFTVNALAYDLAQGQVVDHVGGLADLRAGIIRTITAPHVSIREDPVRMLRAVRFMVRLGFALEPQLAGTMSRMARNLIKVKRHRLAEETQRFLTRSASRRIFEALGQFGLLSPMLGLTGHGWWFAPAAQRKPLPLLLAYLDALDGWGDTGREMPASTPALLGLALALGRPQLRSRLLGLAPPGKKLDAGGGEGTAEQKRLLAELQRMLGDWGLLKGQVPPAMQILTAMRWILNQRKGRAGKRKQAPPGAREAWMLLALLSESLGLRPEIAQRAQVEMQELPVLAIHDHMPGTPHGNRNRGRRRPPMNRPTAQDKTGKDQEGPRPAPPRRRRRGRRGRLDRNPASA